MGYGNGDALPAARWLSYGKGLRWLQHSGWVTATCNAGR
jgi:hypothetical protein